MEFFIHFKMGKQEKNNTQTPLYAITAEGEIIFMIIEAKFSIMMKKKILQ